MYQGWSSPKRWRIASSVSTEIAGFSAMVLRKSPGASWSSRNVSADMPSRSGKTCSRRRSRKVRIARSGSDARRAGLREHPIDVPENPVRDHRRLQVAEPIPHRDLDLDGRQPLHEALPVDDLLDLGPGALALVQVEGGHVGRDQAVDLGLGRGLGL